VKAAALVLVAASLASAQMRVIAQPGKSPLVTFRVVFTTGAMADPADKPGLAYLTAHLLADGGTRTMTYRQVVDALFPMAAGVDVQVDKEMTTFSGATHVDNLNGYYQVLHDMLLDPGWREEDFARVREDAINAIRVGLRSNDEELGKEVLYQNIFAGTPYGHYDGGDVSALERITLDDVKNFYHGEYSQSHLMLGIAGGYPQDFVDRVKKDFRTLPESAGFRPREEWAKPIERTRAVIVEKDTRSVAISLGFPIALTRQQPDYAALLLAASYLGQHRMSSGLLYSEMREKRGLNYGDYAYIEYFPRGMYLMEPEPNLMRQFQIFQIWVRPVEPPNAKFALRLALYELDKLIQNGISQADFERTRKFLIKYVNVLTRTRSAELGYAIDGVYLDQPDYNTYLKEHLAKLTREDVNTAIRRYLRTDLLVIAAVSRNGEALKQELASPAASPMTYNSPKPDAVMEEDKTVEKWLLKLKAEDITVVSAEKVFQ
jgi:zinc protease